MALYEVNNEMLGITAQVHNHTSGYSVTLRDDESGEYVPAAIIFTNEAAAIAKAHKLASV